MSETTSVGAVSAPAGIMNGVGEDRNGGRGMGEEDGVCCA